MTDQITPIIDKLYWNRNGENYELVRQTQAAETVFFIATAEEYKAITQAERIERLEKTLSGLLQMIDFHEYPVNSMGKLLISDANLLLGTTPEKGG